jgi:uncharacterized protein (DUF2236 family)
MPYRADVVVARKINRETVVLLGWGRAILLQLAHPLVAAGVREFSHFGDSAGGYVRRVRRTVGGMLDITFGTEAAAREAIRRINGIHGQVHGQLKEGVGAFPAGTPYTATDPALLLWVHATLIDSMITAYQALVGPLTTDEQDRFCAEAAVTGEALGIPMDAMPSTVAALREYMARMYAGGDIVVGPDARALAAQLFLPPLGPAVPLFRITRLVTVGLMPSQIREGYRFEWDAKRERAFRAVMAVIRGVRRLLPASLREWPISRVA